VLNISTAGDIKCLYTELLDLSDLGEMTVRRASLVEWDDDRRGWTVAMPNGSFLAGPFVSRSEAIKWEIAYWNNTL